MKNLKAILLLIGFFLYAMIALAQPRPGFKAGVNFASLSGYEGENLIGVHAGFYVNCKLDKNDNTWRVQPELLYSGEGQRYSVDGVKQTLSLHYVTMPLMIQYFPFPSAYIEAGPQFGILVSAQSKTSDGVHENLKRSFASTEFGLNAGIGFWVNTRVGFHARYHFGLCDVTPYQSGTNRGQVGQVGIMVNLKK